MRSRTMPGRALALHGAAAALRHARRLPAASVFSPLARRKLPGAAAGVLLGFFLATAQAHEAPAGWSYSADCCNTRDCAPARAGQIREERRDGVLGYAVRVPLGTHHHARVPVDAFVPMGDPRIRVSGDEDRHVCLGSDGRVFCIYVPPGGV